VSEPICCATQAEFDAALAAGGDADIELTGDATFNASAAPASRTLRCYGSSQPSVEAYGSSQPRVVAYGSSQPSVVASGSSQPRVEAYGSSQLSLAQLHNAKLAVQAGPDVAIQASGAVEVTGGRVVVEAHRPDTPARWCEHYGVVVTDGVALLFKAVEDDWRGQDKRGTLTYRPGATPEEPKWDGGKAECGRGLHFSPRPTMALRFCTNAAHFVACPVALTDIAVHPDGEYPEKCKAKRVCAPTFEVDIDGELVGASA